jgi:hypothetical protein
MGRVVFSLCNLYRAPRRGQRKKGRDEMMVPQRRETRTSSKENDPTESRSFSNDSINSIRGIKRFSGRGGCSRVFATGNRRCYVGVVALMLLAFLVGIGDQDVHDIVRRSVFSLDVDVVSNHDEQPAVDAAVFIVMGDLASGPAAALAVESLKVRGEWHGPIVILSDRVSCLSHLNDGSATVRGEVALVEVSDLPDENVTPSAWLLAVKAVKCRLFELIDESAGRSLR